MPLLFAILQMSLIVIAFGLCAYLFITLKHELHAADRDRKLDAEGTGARMDALQIEIAELRKELESFPAQRGPVPGSGINMNKRSQALKMLRVGEGPELIASALSMPKKEVELLIKVQRLLLDSSNYPTS